MKRMMRMGAGLAVCLIAAVASAQPTITSLGSGVPLSVTNNVGGTTYVGGSGTSTTAAARWTLNGGSLSVFEVPGSVGGGFMSADGNYLTSLVLNGPTRFAVGYATATSAVSPAFNSPSYAIPAIPSILAPQAALPATNENGGGRWSFSGNTMTNLGVAPILGFTPNPAASTISTIACSAGVMTVTTTAAHGLAVNDQVYISGNTVNAYNGVFTVTAVSGLTFQYAVTCGAAGTGGTARKFDVGNSGVFGPSSSGGSGSNFVSPNAISPNGRFVVGQTYVAVYNQGATAGTSISANSFYWRPFVWDAQGNAGAGAFDILPTPFRTSTSAGANTRRRTGTAYAVSNDGLVIAGATEHNIGASNGPDVDGGRFVVWRWNAGTSKYDMSYLNTGFDSSGFPKGVSSTASALVMNAAGTIIVARGPDGITKWVWNGTDWGTPNVIGSNLSQVATIVTAFCSSGIVTVTTNGPHGLSVDDNINIAGNVASGTLPSGSTGFNGYYKVTNVSSPTSFDYQVTLCPVDTSSAQVSGSGGGVYRAASWLPFSVTSCGTTPALGAIIRMSDDGSVIAGVATYSTCGSFMAGGFIWHQSDGLIQDWYDYLHAQKADLATTHGPIGDNSDPTRGLPKLGYPSAISPDGSTIAGYQGGNQLIPGATPWVVQFSGGSSCVAPAFSLNPSNATFTRCATFGGVILNASSLGTLPLTYQWYKDGQPLSDGTSVGGGTITGATTTQIRINPPGLLDAGSYTCVATGCNGLTATSNASTVAPDTLLTNTTCATAAPIVGEGTTTFNMCNVWTTPAEAACSAPSELASAWFQYTPSFTGEARFQTCGSTFDTTLTVKDACDGVEMACSNDVGARGLAGVGTSCSANRSVISRLMVTAGVPVFVRVGAVALPTSTSATSGTLVISQAPAAPVNDLCANATVVRVGTYAFNLNEATDDYTFGTTGCSTPAETTAASNRDVWFRLDAPCGGTYSFTTCGSTITNPMLHIMAADCSNSVAFCDDNTSGCSTGGTSQAQILNLVITGPVLIRVSMSGTGSPGTAATSGTGLLNITGTSAINCLGTCCSGATPPTCSAMVEFNTCNNSFFLGGTSCSPSPCPTATGACCSSVGLCTAGVTSADCIAGSGTYKGDASVCNPTPCPKGACCDGTSCTIVILNDCAASYLGNNTTCTSNPCPGACCVAATGDCQTATSASNCTTLGGTYQGIGVVCGSVSCPQPTGACCTGVVCSGPVTAAVCGAGWQGYNTVCNPSPCPGACCDGLGGCTLQTSANCAPSNFQGNGVACGPTNCGICCRGSTCVASVFTSAACQSSIPNGAGAGFAYVTNTACGADHKVPCCHADYDHVNGKNVADIFAYLTDWFAHSPYAWDGTPNAANAPVSQIFAFLSDWFAGC